MGRDYNPQTTLYYAEGPDLRFPEKLVLVHCAFDDGNRQPIRGDKAVRGTL